MHVRVCESACLCCSCAAAAHAGSLCKPLLLQLLLLLQHCAGMMPSLLNPAVACLPINTRCSAAMTLFYVWNLLLFKPNLPAKLK